LSFAPSYWVAGVIEFVAPMKNQTETYATANAASIGTIKLSLLFSMGFEVKVGVFNEPND